MLDIASLTAATTPAVSVRNLRKSFGSLEVLKGISFDAREGEVISVLGSSGSGKSTMLRCINMLEVPTEGEVHIAGEQVRLKTSRHGRQPADPRQLSRLCTNVAMVFQSFNLWSHMTILENLMEAPVYVQKRPKAECREEALDLLAKVGIADKRDYYPSHLSGGQQQRAAIARALAMRPKVLRVMRALADEGRTMLVVTHEMSFARDVSNRVIFLHQGLIEEDGDPSDVFTAPRSERFRKFISSHG
jgi:octopine/nopaline transport system ATP-binding protein